MLSVTYDFIEQQLALLRDSYRKVRIFSLSCPIDFQARVQPRVRLDPFASEFGLHELDAEAMPPTMVCRLLRTGSMRPGYRKPVPQGFVSPLTDTSRSSSASSNCFVA